VGPPREKKKGRGSSEGRQVEILKKEINVKTNGGKTKCVGRQDT